MWTNITALSSKIWSGKSIRVPLQMRKTATSSIEMSVDLVQVIPSFAVDITQDSLLYGCKDTSPFFSSVGANPLGEQHAQGKAHLSVFKHFAVLLANGEAHAQYTSSVMLDTHFPQHSLLAKHISHYWFSHQHTASFRCVFGGGGGVTNIAHLTYKRARE